MHRAALLLVLWMVAPAMARADGCLSYAGRSVIEGTLTRHTFAEQPNYESIAKGDAAATYFFLEPAAPLCVAQGADPDDQQLAEPTVQRVQLVFMGDAAATYDRLRPALGQPVRCDGALFHAQTGHHHSPVLLEVAQCAPVAESAVSTP